MATQTKKKTVESYHILLIGFTLVLFSASQLAYAQSYTSYEYDFGKKGWQDKTAFSSGSGSRSWFPLESIIVTTVDAIALRSVEPYYTYNFTNAATPGEFAKMPSRLNSTAVLHDNLEPYTLYRLVLKDPIIDDPDYIESITYFVYMPSTYGDVLPQVSDSKPRVHHNASQAQILACILR